MEKCLVTKLQGVIDDDSLPKIGELVILPQEGKIDVSLGFTEGTTIRTFGDAYFTDENYAQNLGTTKELTAYNGGSWGDRIYVKVVNNGGLKVPIYKLRIFINIKGIGDYNRFAFASPEKSRFSFNSEDNFDFARFSKESSFGYIKLNRTKKQDISCINSVNGLSDTLDLSNSSMYGDISVLKKFSKFNSFFPPATVKGEVSQINGCQLGFDSASFVPCTWKQTRPTTHQIMAIQYADFGTDIDKMLNDQSACVANTQSQSWFKKIICKGTRTSASDAAITTLQQKDYTVSITPA
jgi:hypothetical protein